MRQNSTVFISNAALITNYIHGSPFLIFDYHGRVVRICSNASRVMQSEDFCPL